MPRFNFRRWAPFLPTNSDTKTSCQHLCYSCLLFMKQVPTGAKTLESARQSKALLRSGNCTSILLALPRK